MRALYLVSRPSADRNSEVVPVRIRTGEWRVPADAHFTKILDSQGFSVTLLETSSCAVSPERYSV